MDEIELKFGIPTERLAALQTQVARGKVRVERLQAAYFDTADGRLAGAGIALRLRREGDRWMQTAKADRGHTVRRLEHNAWVPTPTPGAVPLLDLARHDGTPIGEALAKALGQRSAATAPLDLVFQTDVERMSRVVSFRGARIELALDLGTVMAQDRSEAICELEFELKAGELADLSGFAARWARTHGLWLSSLSKAERGRRLATGSASNRHVPAPVVTSDAGPRHWLAATIQACMRPILAHATAVAEGSHEDTDVHQLRVGLRRLRTALRELGGAAAGTDPAWESSLAEAFRELGNTRDRTVVVPPLAAEMQAAGAPALPLDFATSGRSALEVVRDPDWQQTLLALIAFADQLTAGDDGSVEDTRALIVASLARLQHQVARDGKRFESLPAADQHRVRKRLKRLRYLAEFAAPLFRDKAVERFVRRWRDAQDALGAFNDEHVAAEWFKEQATRSPHAWFAVGWLESRRPRLARRCARALREARRATPFWQSDKN